MSSWNSRGLRGSSLEELINLTNDRYREKELALVQKIPTPIKPINIDHDTRRITLAFFDQKSTVDYIGVVQGVPVCFDAKECAGDRFPIQNIHEHQVEYMREYEKQQGVAFLIIYFVKLDIYYYLTFKELDRLWQRAASGGPKSFAYDELDPRFQISPHNGVFVHYLEPLQLDLMER